MNNFMFIPPSFLQNSLLLLRLDFVAYFLESGDKIFVLFKFKTNANVSHRAINRTPNLCSVERLRPRIIDTDNGIAHTIIGEILRHNEGASAGELREIFSQGMRRAISFSCRCPKR